VASDGCSWVGGDPPGQFVPGHRPRERGDPDPQKTNSPRQGMQLSISGLMVQRLSPPAPSPPRMPGNHNQIGSRCAIRPLPPLIPVLQYARVGSESTRKLRAAAHAPIIFSSRFAHNFTLPAHNVKNREKGTGIRDQSAAAAAPTNHGLSPRKSFAMTTFRMLLF
jgi:hypothetical protein